MSTRINPVTQQSFGRGMVTVVKKNQIPDDALAYVQNADIDIDGSIASRKGCSLFGNRLSSDGRILSTHTCTLRDGSEIVLRLRSDQDNSKAVLEWFNPDYDANGLWENLFDPTPSLDPDTRASFVQWNTTPEDRVYMGNGKQQYIKWLCITSVVASNDGTTVTLADGSSFPYAGSVRINGTTYTYTGRTGNQLTGMTIVGTFTVNQGVAILPTNPSMTANAAITITIATPAVVSLTAHGLVEGDTVRFITTGALPTGITAGTEYFVISAGLTANAFEIATIRGGPAINTSGGQSGVHYLSIPLSNILHAHLARLYVGKGSAFVYSISGSPEDFRITGNPGSGGIEDFPEGGGDITGLSSKGKWLVIKKKNIIRNFSLDQSALADPEFPVSEILAQASNIGPLSQASIATWLKEVYYVSQQYGLRQLTQVLAATDSAQPLLDILPLADMIRRTVANFDSSDAAAAAFDSKVFSACKSDDDQAGNDVIVVYDFRTKGFVLYKGWNVNDFFIYQDELYFGSSTEANCFKCFDGYTDDGGPIEVQIKTKQYDYNEPSFKKEDNLIFMDGRIGVGTEINVTIDLEIDGDLKQIEKTIESDGDYVQESQGGDEGEEELGLTELGGPSDEDDDLNPFKVNMTLPITNHYNFSLNISSVSDGGRFEINSIASNPTAQKEPAAASKI